MSDPVKPESATAVIVPSGMPRLVPLLLLACLCTFAGIVVGGIAGYTIAYFTTRPANPFSQSGHFQTIQGTQGVVHFPIPYRSPPNVQLFGDPIGALIIIECTKEGFTWKNAGGTEFWNKGAVQWTAQGMR